MGKLDPVTIIETRVIGVKNIILYAVDSAYPRTLGVELEGRFPCRASKAQALGWELVPDGSLSAGYEELVSPLGMTLAEIRPAMNELDWWIDRKCGGHIHVTFPARYAVETLEAYLECVLKELERLFPKRANEYYCDDGVARRDNKTYGHPEWPKKKAYPGIAIRDNTIEFRIFPAFHCVEQILNRATVAQKIIDAYASSVSDDSHWTKSDENWTKIAKHVCAELDCDSCDEDYLDSDSEWHQGDEIENNGCDCNHCGERHEDEECPNWCSECGNYHSDCDDCQFDPCDDCGEPHGPMTDCDELPMCSNCHSRHSLRKSCIMDGEIPEVTIDGATAHVRNQKFDAYCSVADLSRISSCVVNEGDMETMLRVLYRTRCQMLINLDRPIDLSYGLTVIEMIDGIWQACMSTVNVREILTNSTSKVDRELMADRLAVILYASRVEIVLYLEWMQEKLQERQENHRLQLLEKQAVAIMNNVRDATVWNDYDNYGCSYTIAGITIRPFSDPSTRLKLTEHIIANIDNELKTVLEIHLTEYLRELDLKLEQQTRDSERFQAQERRNEHRQMRLLERAKTLVSVPRSGHIFTEAHIFEVPVKYATGEEYSATIDQIANIPRDGILFNRIYVQRYIETCIAEVKAIPPRIDYTTFPLVVEAETLVREFDAVGNRYMFSGVELTVRTTLGEFDLAIRNKFEHSNRIIVGIRRIFMNNMNNLLGNKCLPLLPNKERWEVYAYDYLTVIEDNEDVSATVNLPRRRSVWWRLLGGATVVLNDGSRISRTENAVRQLEMNFTIEHPDKILLNCRDHVFRALAWCQSR